MTCFGILRSRYPPSNTRSICIGEGLSPVRDLVAGRYFALATLTPSLTSPKRAFDKAFHNAVCEGTLIDLCRRRQLHSLQDYGLPRSVSGGLLL